MRKNKTINKPSFIKIFCLYLAVLWAITAVVSGITYMKTDATMQIYEQDKMYSCLSSVSSLCEDYYIACSNYELFRYDPDQREEDLLLACKKKYEKLTYSMDLAAAEGFYTELHVKGYDFDRNPSGGEDVDIVKPTFTNGVAAHYIWDVGMVIPDEREIYGCAVDPTTLSFENNGEKITFDRSDRLSVEDTALGKVESNIIQYDNNVGFPAWFFPGFLIPETSTGYIAKMVSINDCYLDRENMKFFPQTIVTYYEGPERIWTNENSYDTDDWFLSSVDILKESHDVRTSTLVVLYEPQDLPSSDDITIAYDGQTYHYLNDKPQTISIGMSNGARIDAELADELDDSGWVLYIAAPEYVSFFDRAPSVVILNFALRLFISLIIALVISYILFIRRRSVYQIVEYRKKVTENMAHDLKTPLASISAYAENLEENINSDKRGYYTEKIRENVNAMNSMIEGVLDFSRSDNVSIRAQLKEHSVKEMLNAEYEAVRELFDKKDISVVIEGKNVIIKTDDKLFRQALKNLMSNAVKFTRKGTTVRIDIDESKLTMVNKTDEKIDNIGDLKKPFVKGSGSRSEGVGTGLGLSIAESCLEACGHKLDVTVEGDEFKAVTVYG